MDILARLTSARRSRPHQLESAVSRRDGAAQAASDLARQLAGVDAAAILVFASPRYDASALAAALKKAFGPVPVIGCTTAGEITPLGYETGALTGVALPKRHFRVSPHLLRKLSEFSMDDGIHHCREATAQMSGEPGWSSVALLFADGMSKQEEMLLSVLEPGLAPTPILGGSAGAGLDYGQPYVFFDGLAHPDAALLAVVETNCPFTELRFDHYLPTDQRMVVTEADAAKRLVLEFNAEPAAQEYARAVGCDEADLSPFVFATHPTLVRVGGRYHVRAIRRQEDGDGLSFLCAIDEGLVMTLGKAQDIVTHLDQELTTLTASHGPPALILGFDCILRRLEAERLKKYHAVSDVLSRNRVIGFSTYGEQFHGMHVNQTFVGVAFHQPDEPGAGGQG